MKKTGASHNRPEVATSSKAIRTTSLSRSRSDRVLTLDDINCPICLNVYIHPVTLPCMHTLCHGCFCRSIRITALSCPFCRRRLSVWSRKAIKEKTLIDHAFMRQIKKQFPEVVAARVAELKREEEEAEDEEEEDDERGEDGYNSVQSLMVRTAERTPTTSSSESSFIHEPRLGRNNSEQRPKLDGVLSKPGEIAHEYKTLMQKYQAECEKEKAKQISKSEALIEQLTQEDQQIQKPSPAVTKTTTVNGKNQKRKSNNNNNLVISPKENRGNSLSSSTTTLLDSGIFSSASSSSSFSTSSTSLMYSKTNGPGPSRQSKVQLLNIYNTPSSSSSSTLNTLLNDVDVEAEKEAFERFKSKLEQEEKDRKMALRLQKELRKMDLEPPSKRITRSNIPNTRSRLANRPK